MSRGNFYQANIYVLLWQIDRHLQSTQLVNGFKHLIYMLRILEPYYDCIISDKLVHLMKIIGARIEHCNENNDN